MMVSSNIYIYWVPGFAFDGGFHLIVNEVGVLDEKVTSVGGFTEAAFSDGVVVKVRLVVGASVVV